MTVRAAGLAGYIREYMEEFIDPPAPEEQVEGPDWHDPGPDDPDGDIEARVWTAMTVAMDSELRYLSGRGLVRVIEAAQLVISRLQAMQEQPSQNWRCRDGPETPPGWRCRWPS